MVHPKHYPLWSPESGKNLTNKNCNIREEKCRNSKRKARILADPGLASKELNWVGLA